MGGKEAVGDWVCTGLIFNAGNIQSLTHMSRHPDHVFIHIYIYVYISILIYSCSTRCHSIFWWKLHYKADYTIFRPVKTTWACHFWMHMFITDIFEQMSNPNIGQVAVRHLNNVSHYKTKFPGNSTYDKPNKPDWSLEIASAKCPLNPLAAFMDPQLQQSL